MIEIEGRRSLRCHRRCTARLLGGLALATLVAGCATSTAAGSICGHILPTEDGPLAVLATPLDESSAPAPRSNPVIRLRGAFAPSFLVVGINQYVRFVNEDTIYHRLFSTTDFNKFDLGTLERGESRIVRMRHPGPVRFYCALHEEESGLVLVAPTPHYSSVGPSGKFALKDLSPGRYELETWSERRPSSEVDVVVAAGEDTSVEIVLLPARPSR